MTPSYPTAKSPRQGATGGAKVGYYMGIDPGTKGAIVVLLGGKIHEWRSLTDLTTEEIWWYLWERRYAKCCIERVSGYIGDGHPGSAMFNFGRGYGKLLMGLTAAGISHSEVLPKQWQKSIGMAKLKGESKVAWKNRLEQKARILFPKQPINEGNADAVLIAYHCQLIYGA